MQNWLQHQLRPFPSWFNMWLTSSSWAMAQNQKSFFFKERPRAQEESTKQRFDRVVECYSKPRIIIDQAKSQLYGTPGSGYQSHLRASCQLGCRSWRCHGAEVAAESQCTRIKRWLDARTELAMIKPHGISRKGACYWYHNRISSFSGVYREFYEYQILG